MKENIKEIFSLYKNGFITLDEAERLIYALIDGDLNKKIAGLSSEIKNKTYATGILSQNDIDKLLYHISQKKTDLGNINNSITK